MKNEAKEILDVRRDYNWMAISYKQSRGHDRAKWKKQLDMLDKKMAELGEK